MSRTLDQAQVQTQQTQRAPTRPADDFVTTANSDALAEMSTSEGSLAEGGFLDGLMAEQEELADLEKRAAGPTDFVSNPKLALERSSKNEADGTEDKATVGTDLKSITGGYQMSQTEGNRTSSHTLGGKLDRDKASVSLGGSDWTETGKSTGHGSAWNVSADTDGNVGGTYTFKNDKTATSVGGNTDFAEDGSLEHVDASVGHKTANGTAIKGQVSVDPTKIETKGRTVSWSGGIEAGAEVARGTGSGGGTLGAAQKQTRTFATEEEAQAFAATLTDTWHDNRELDFANMDPGTAASFFLEVTGSGKGGAGVVNGKAEGSYAQRFDISCNAAGMLDVTIDQQAVAHGGFEAAAGMLAAGGGASKEAQASAQLQVDPKSPAALAALQALIEGGQLDPSVDIPGLTFGMETDDRSCVDGTMDLVVAQLAEKACQGKGVYRDPTTGEHGQLDSAHTAESESGKLAWLSSLFGYDRSDRQGSSSEDAKVYDPEFVDGRSGTHMRFKQVFDYQQREVSRRLHDQVTPYQDREAIDEHVLPSPDAPGMDEKQQWILETVVDAEGTQAVFDALAHGDQSFEWEAQRRLHGVREGLVSGESTPAEAVTAMAQAGEDAYEGMRDIAGPEHTERFLMQEGSDVWIGREANQAIERQLDALAHRVAIGDPRAEQELLEMLRAEEQRDEQLGEEFANQLSGVGAGVPVELIAEAMDRAGERCVAIQRILDNKEPR